MNFHVVHTLITEMGRIVIETKTLVPLLTAAMASWALAISKGDFGRVNLESEVHIVFFKSVEDRPEALRKIGESCVPERLRCRRKPVKRMPDA